jgi:hypothetical protein
MPKGPNGMELASTAVSIEGMLRSALREKKQPGNRVPNRAPGHMTPSHRSATFGHAPYW